MDDITKYNLLQGIKAKAFTENQAYEALQAIKADKPDAEVADLMSSLSFVGLNSGKSLDQLVDERLGRDREKFDYTTGGDGTLRSLMSFGETEAEREGILSGLVGEEGFIRDNSGRLALTEAGQKARGMEPIGKNLVIEDEGFSMRDFSDMAGILPETIGSVVGAIAAGAPTLGFGAVAGAGAGAAAGQAIEEIFEGMLGYQKQSLGEIAKDVAIEGAIGAGGELIGSAVILAGRGIMGGGKALGSRVMGGGASSPLDEIATAELNQADRLLGKGYVPSLESVGAPKPLAYLQKFAENASKTKARIDNNLNIALSEKNTFLSTLSPNAASELTDDVMFFAPTNLAKLKVARDTAHDSYLKAIDDSFKLLKTSADEGVDLNAQTLGSITKAYDGFNTLAKDNFGAVDEILGRIQGAVTVGNRQVMRDGGGLKLFDTNVLKKTIDDFAETSGLTLLPDELKIVRSALGDFGDRASFRNLASLRKNVNDNLFFNPGVGTEASKQLTKVREILDAMLDGDNIIDSISLSGRVTPADKTILKKAADQRWDAIKKYKEGITRFEKLQDTGIIKSINGLKGESPRAIADQFFTKVIRPDSPERLTSLFKAIDNPEEIRSALASRYLDDALDSAKRGLDNAEEFNGVAFKRQIDKLKGTGKVLFGGDWEQVKRLSNQIGKSKVTGLDSRTINRVSKAGGDENITQSLRNILDAQVNLDKSMSVDTLKKVSDGTLSVDDALRAITSPSRTDSEVMRIMEFFSDQPQVVVKMRDVVTKDILDSVDQDIFKSPKSASALADVLESYKPGALKRLLGKDQHEALSGFANDLKSLGDVGKEGSIAAGTIWAKIFSHPLNAMLTLGKYRSLSKVLSNPETVKRYIQMRRGSANMTAAERGNAVMSMMTEAAAESGVDVGSAGAMASKVGNIVRGIGNVASQTSRVTKQTVPRSLMQYQETGTSVPNVEQSGFEDIFNVPAPSQTQGPTRQLGVIEKLQQNVGIEQLRQRAARDPSVAATLLGGLGSAGLLNRP
jgi:hypothetical protein